MAVTYRMQRSRVRVSRVALQKKMKNTNGANYRWHLSSKLLSRRSGPLKNPYKILHLCLGITFAARLYRVESRRHKMQTPSISIYAVAATFVALLRLCCGTVGAALQNGKHQSGIARSLRGEAGRSGRTSDGRTTKAKLLNLPLQQHRLIWVRKVTNWETRSLGAFVSAEKATSLCPFGALRPTQKVRSQTMSVLRQRG